MKLMFTLCLTDSLALNKEESLLLLILLKQIEHFVFILLIMYLNLGFAFI